MTDLRARAEKPLPGAPDPWVASSMPEPRAGRPYLMEEMITAEPGLAVRVAERVVRSSAAAELARAVAKTAAGGRPVSVTGCGTSEHAAMGIAALLGDALPAERAHLVRSRQALDALRDPGAPGLVIGVSHEGGTWATNEALAAARAAGSRTAAITVSARSPIGAPADLVVETGEQDQSWCHTVGYLSPLVAGTALAALLRDEALDLTAVGTLVRIAIGEAGATGDVAAALAGSRRLLVAGAGVDLVSARELALKIEEGAHLPATALHLESVRHGHLAAVGPETGVVVVATDASPAAAPLRDRATAVLRSAAALGMPVAALLGASVGPEIHADLTPAGRLTAPEANRLPPLAEALVGAAAPLQLLALHLAVARGINPDPIGRDDPRQAAAAEA